MDKLSRSQAMDGVRGLAVLIVFLSHTSGRGQAISPLLQFHGIGHVGVYLFFVLSGYLLADNLLSEHAKNGKFSIKNFFIRRFLRIAPLYYFIVTAVFVFQELSGEFYKDYLHVEGGQLGYLKHIVFYQGDSLFWTIPAEFSFYLVLPFLMLLMIRYSKYSLALLGCFIVGYFIWASLVIFHFIPSTYAPRLVDISHQSQFLDVLLSGVLAAFVQRSAIYCHYSEANTETLNVFGLWILILTISLTFCLISFDFLGLDRPLYEFRWFSLFYGVMFASIILITRLNGIVARFFESPILTFMGMVGFSWYLIHFAVIQIVNFTHLTSPLRFLVTTLICSILSWVLFVAIENPFIKLAKKITR